MTQRSGEKLEKKETPKQSVLSHWETQDHYFNVLFEMFSNALHFKLSSLIKLIQNMDGNYSEMILLKQLIYVYLWYSSQHIH